MDCCRQPSKGSRANPRALNPSLLICVLGAGLAFSGCGAQRLTEPPFSLRADRICARLNGHPVVVTNGSKSSLTRGLARIQDLVDRLKQLRPPANDERLYRELLARLQSAVVFVRVHQRRLITMERALPPKHASPSEVQRFKAHLLAFFAPVVRDARTAALDARRLGLHNCESGLTGSGLTTQTATASAMEPSRPLGARDRRAFLRAGQHPEVSREGGSRRPGASVQA